MSRVAVVGGGLAGLLAAYRLLRQGHEVALREASPTFGGMIASVDLAGLRVDSGAEAYATRGGTAAPLMAELGLEVAAPTGDPHVWWPTGIYPLANGVLGIPASLDDPALDALTHDERVVAARDLVLGPEVGADATTVGELVEARLGRAVVDKLVAPLTTGVYGSEPMKLKLFVAPGLLPALASEGSLTAAVAKIRRPGAASVEQPVGGMFRLIDVLVDRISSLGGDLRAGSPVENLQRALSGSDRSLSRARNEPASKGPKLDRDTAAVTSAGAFTLTTHDGETLTSDRVILATPAAVAQRLLGQLGPELDVPPVKLARHVMLAAMTPELRTDPVGSGVLMGTTDPSVRAKALTHYSAKWPWTRTDAPFAEVSISSTDRVAELVEVPRAERGVEVTVAPVAGQDVSTRPTPRPEVLRVSYPEHILPTREEAIADASALTGVAISDTDVVGFASLGWETMPTRIDPATRDRLIAAAAEVGVELVGAWLDGNGISSVVAGVDRVTA